MSTGATAKPRFRVRKQSSGYTFSETYYVYDAVARGRVSVHAHRHAETAQREADGYNIAAMVKDYADDPRPYEVRYAEAEAAYRSER